MRIVSFIEKHQSEVVEKIPRHGGLWKEAPPRAPPEPVPIETVEEPALDYGFTSTRLGAALRPSGVLSPAEASASDFAHLAKPRAPVLRSPVLRDEGGKRQWNVLAPALVFGFLNGYFGR